MKYFYLPALFLFFNIVYSANVECDFVDALKPDANQYKVQATMECDMRITIIDITNTLFCTVNDHKRDFLEKKKDLFGKIECGYSSERLFQSDVQIEMTTDILQDTILRGINHRFYSEFPLIFHRCMFSFGKNIEFVAAHIHIGASFFIPSNLDTCIVFRCPSDIRSLLESIIIRPDSKISIDRDTKQHHLYDQNLKSVCDASVSDDDYSFHFEGWVKFPEYGIKSGSIFFSFNKNWVVDFNYRS